MNCVSAKSAIADTFSNVRGFSYEEKKSPLCSEERINKVLDKILDFKTALNRKSEKIESLNDKIEKLTWFDDVNEECLMLINDLISSIKDLHSTLIRQYISFNFLRSRNIAKEEIKRFKYAVDDMKESYQDLESRFFFLPALPDFEETTRSLSLV